MCLFRLLELNIMHECFINRITKIMMLIFLRPGIFLCCQLIVVSLCGGEQRREFSPSTHRWHDSLHESFTSQCGVSMLAMQAYYNIAWYTYNMLQKWNLVVTLLSTLGCHSSAFSYICLNSLELLQKLVTSTNVYGQTKALPGRLII